jgi:lauroyl/myristoyl acyltransferase
VARGLTTRLLIAGLEGLTWLAGVIPRYPHAEILCRLAGIAWYLGAPAARSAVRDNLRHIRGHSPTWLDVLSVFQNGALNYWDTFAITRLSREQLLALVDVHGREHIDAALEHGKGVIVASAHLGSVALVAQVVPSLGYPSIGLLEPIDPPELYAFFARQRQGHGIRLLPVGRAGLREVVTALRRNEVVGLIADREFGTGGGWVDFFDARVRFADGPASLAVRSGALVLVAVCARKSNGRFDAWFEPLPSVLTGGDQKANVQAVTQAIARRLEYYVASHPAQWTVFQKRWPG